MFKFSSGKKETTLTSSLSMFVFLSRERSWCVLKCHHKHPTSAWGGRRASRTLAEVWQVSGPWPRGPWTQILRYLRFTAYLVFCLLVVWGKVLVLVLKNIIVCILYNMLCTIILSNVIFNFLIINVSKSGMVTFDEFEGNHSIFLEVSIFRFFDEFKIFSCENECKVDWGTVQDTRYKKMLQTGR